MKPFLFIAISLTWLLTSCHRNPHTTIPGPDLGSIAIADTTSIAADTVDIYAAVANEDSLLGSEVQKLFNRDLAHANSTVFTDSLEISGSVLGRIQTNIRAGLLFDKKNRFALVKQVSGNGINIPFIRKATMLITRCLITEYLK